MVIDGAGLCCISRHCNCRGRPEKFYVLRGLAGWPLACCICILEVLPTKIFGQREHIAELNAAGDGLYASE